MKNKYRYAGIFLALLPILIFRDYTPDNELRYLSIVDEALRNGNFMTFTFQGLIYADKPPLYFWFMMLGKLLFGTHHMWFISLFSILPALAITAVMDKWVSKELPVAYREAGVYLMMSCGLFLGMAIVLRMDMLMCLFMILALRSFYRMWKKQGNGQLESYLFPVYLFMALFSKGPVGLVVPLASTLLFLLYKKQIRTLAHYWGLKTWSILLLGCALWFGGVFLEKGPEYLHNLLFHQTFGRMVGSFHHAEPFYYYLTTIWYSLAPWSLLFIGVILVSLKRKLIKTDLQQFFLVILTVTFVFLSLVSSKIAVYMLPAFPFFVYLTVLLLPHFRWNRWLGLSIAVPAIIFSVSLPGLMICTMQKGLEFLKQGFFYAGASLLTVCGVITLYVLYRKKDILAPIRILVIGLFAAVFIGGWALPSINQNLGYSEVCQKAIEVASQKHLSGYHVWKVRRAESMDVFFEEDVRQVTTEDILNDKLNKTLLLLPSRKLTGEDQLKEYLSDKEKYIVGPYMIIVL